ncbi:MAG: hypothetical protein ACPGUC_00795 [Gammaproteobacteria bacterium]
MDIEHPAAARVLGILLALCAAPDVLALSEGWNPEDYGGGGATSARQMIEKPLLDTGVDAGKARQISGAVEQAIGASLSGPLHDRVDFSRFPNARISVSPLDTPAALLLVPETAAYVFTGKPTTFQGSFRSYEFHLGQGLHQASALIFGQMFPRLRGIGSRSELTAGELLIVPRLDDFSFGWGGSFSPVMVVDLATSISISRDGALLYQGAFPVSGVKEEGQSVFPNADQEHRAISTALIQSLKKAITPLAGQRAQLLPDTHAPRAASAVLPAASRPGTASEPVPQRTLDMDAVYFLADSWEKYDANKGRLSRTERQVAMRILRLRDAQNSLNEDVQANELAALRKIAQDKGLRPSSRDDLVAEIRRHHGYRDAQVIADNASADRFYNFAGDRTDDVLKYAGLGIDLTKAGVVAVGCLGSAGTLCPALVGTMASFSAVNTAAEGLGAASAKYFDGGSAGEVMFEGAKAVVIDVAAGKAGELGGELLSSAAHQYARSTTKALTKDLPENLIKRGNSAVYVGVMEDTYKVAAGGISAYEAFTKQLTKDVIEAGEKQLTSTKSNQKAVPAGTGPDLPTMMGLPEI